MTILGAVALDSALGQASGLRKGLVVKSGSVTNGWASKWASAVVQREERRSRGKRVNHTAERVSGSAEGRGRDRSRLVQQDGGRVAVVDGERIWTDLQSLIKGTEDAVFSRRSD